MDSRGSTMHPAPRRLLRIEEVMERIGLKRSAVFAAVARGELPAPIKVLPGHRASRWDSHAIDRWIAERVEGSKDQAA